jgi:predicted nucleic acid-binding protein
MILLDTNVVSEMMRVSPAEKVRTWIGEQETTQLFISTITIAEISYGINALPKGKRRDLLDDAFNKLIKEAFEHRILPFEQQSAVLYGKLMSHRKELGKPLGILDGQIAAIARAHGKRLATRNLRDFVNCELDLINPFG